VKEALPNDPGYLMARTSCPEPFDTRPMFQPWGDEHYEINHTIMFRDQPHIVTLRFSYAKEQARQGANPGSTDHGQHAAKNVGISIMRAGRELDLDQTWVIKYDPVERWWGVEIEFPPALDELFGVTNNKQAARNFAELSKLDLDTLLKDRTIIQAMDELIEEDDPRAPLLEIAHRIRTNVACSHNRPKAVAQPRNVIALFRPKPLLLPPHARASRKGIKVQAIKTRRYRQSSGRLRSSAH
jgi:hypothetical protein